MTTTERSPFAGPVADDDLLVITNLSGGFRAVSGEFSEVLHDVSFSIPRGQLTAIVGETGSGKSLTALTILGLTPRRFERSSGSIVFDGADLARYDEREMRKIRGAAIAMVFQDSRGALNPVFTIGTQLGDVYRLHRHLGKGEARAASEEMLARVRITEPGQRLRQYPHELSGGTVQRVQLAMALACQPSLLILDEPTTGLDVTIQADILELIVELTHEFGTTTCMITHDLGVVAETCNRVVVMRSGTVRESGSCEQIMTRPTDSYTRDLLEASRANSKSARSAWSATPAPPAPPAPPAASTATSTRST